MKLRYAGTTHVGVRRKHNEDNFVMVPEQRLYVVADGMGGHACGEVASQITVETLGSFYKDSADDDELTWPCKLDRELSGSENRLRAGVKLANLRIFEKAQMDAKYKGMGTTVVVAYFHGNSVVVAHVGDSRVYRLREGSLTQLTEDHSLLNDYKKMATLTEEEERNFPHKNIIVRALGMKEIIDVDIQTDAPLEGDIYLLCSDGLNGELEDTEIESILVEAETIEESCAVLIEAACENGGKDNVTVVLVQVTA
jgi:serine/threonine protein phosphatase PrpC